MSAVVVASLPVIACQPTPVAIWRDKADQHGIQPGGLRFTSNARYLVGRAGFDVVIFEVPGGRVVGTSAAASHGKLLAVPAGMDVSPNGRRVAFVTNGSLVLARVPDGKQEHAAALSSHEGLVAFSPDGGRLATAHTVLEAWEMPGATRIARAAGRLRVIQAIAFSPDGRTLAAGGIGRSIELWDAESWTLRDSLKLPLAGMSVSTLAFSPDGRHLATGGGPDRTLILWDVVGRQELWRRQLVAYSPGFCLALSPDGRWIVTGGPRGMAMIIDSRTGETVMEWLAHDRRDGVYSAAFSPDGHLLATGGYQGAIRLWDFDRTRGARAR